MEERTEALPAYEVWLIGAFLGFALFLWVGVESSKWGSVSLQVSILATLVAGWFALLRYVADQVRERVVLRDGMLIFELRKFTERFAVEDIVLIRPQADQTPVDDSDYDLLEIVFQDKSIKKLPKRVGLGFALHKLLKGSVNVIDWELTRNS